MCGIVAYTGDSSSVLNTLLTGLKRLEYRGYDSAGLALLTSKGTYVKKSVGKVTILETEISKDEPLNIGCVGIAHTRWATHGPATIENAHPQSSADKSIWVVHNGIIENYQKIKQQLIKKGLRFHSQTDSEVIAKLIGTFYNGDLRDAVLKAVEQLTGAFSICVICSKEPDRLIGLKMSSPLVVGVGLDETILASDVSAIIDKTKKVIYLEDGELIDIRNSNYEVVNFDNQATSKVISTVDWDLDKITKGGYDHFLLKEIMEQPQVIADSIRGRILTDIANVHFGGLIEIQNKLQSIDQVILLGIGTSYYAAKLGELYFNALSGVRAKAEMSPEFRYNTTYIDNKTWVIAISQSGETADTVAAIEEAKRHDALVTGLVNVVGSTIARITDAGIYNHIGPEISVASTKAFTSQSLLLLMQAIMLGRQDGLDYAQAKDTLEKIISLPKKLDYLLNNHQQIETVAKSIHKSRNALYIGRRFNYPIALEGALKIKEISYLHAEGLSAGELKHGFIALIDNSMPTIAIATEDSVTDKMLASIEEIRAREGPVITISNHPIEGAEHQIIVPDIGNEYLQPLINNVALQLLAYYVAKYKHLTIDQPRNLAKSVTVE
ncbi:MAG: glutamine--fructose-6-phosphate transaminase (isomerizing) [Candidatus Saccharimonadales bacterium]